MFGVDDAPQARPRRRVPRLIWAALFLCVLSFLGVMVVRSVVAEPFRIPSGSMAPTLIPGDHILVNKHAYGWSIPLTRKALGARSLPERGDIVVFVYPGSDDGLSRWLDVPLPGISTVDYVKRVIALPGETVSVTEGVVAIDGTPLTPTPLGAATFTDDRCRDYPVEAFEERTGDRSWVSWRNENHGMRMANFGEVVVPPGHVFVLGDNRDHAADSRVWGFVPVENIKGRVERLWTSIDPCTGNTRVDRTLQDIP